MSLWRPEEGARSPGLEGTVAVAPRWECRELSSGPVEEHQCSDLQSSQPQHPTFDFCAPALSSMQEAVMLRLISLVSPSKPFLSIVTVRL